MTFKEWWTATYPEGSAYVTAEAAWTAALSQQRDWEARYKDDLHNFMELERWLNKNHPSVMEEWENSE